MIEKFGLAYAATVTIYYHGLTSTDGLVVRKYNSVTKTYATVTGATITGTSPAKVTYSITDGSSLDEDGVANGAIVDPVGLATPDTLIPGVPNTGVGHRVRASLPFVAIVIIGISAAWPIWRFYRKTR